MAHVFRFIGDGPLQQMDFLVNGILGLFDGNELPKALAEGIEEGWRGRWGWRGNVGGLRGFLDFGSTRVSHLKVKFKYY